MLRSLPEMVAGGLSADAGLLSEPGDKRDTGATGAQGQGEKGDTAAKGETGAAGPTGTKVFGGGVTQTDSKNLIESGPIGTTGWKATYSANMGAGKSATARALSGVR